MGVIGSFGDIVFEVSSEKIRTIDDFSRSASGRWAKHEIMGQKPKSEFLGPDLDVISFKMRFDVQFGVNPKAEMDKLLIMCRNGQAETLIVGGNALGVDKWVIKSVTQNWLRFDGSGRCIVGGADVTLEEYVGE
ncbi:MAG: phage tail protein [Peptococcaceae bacterium]|nr:phage tail protein [Peptococcaceae bacterium]